VLGVTSDGLPHNRRRARHHHHATRAAHAARDTRAGSLAPAPALARAAYRQRHRLRRRSSRRRRERRRSHPSCRPCLRRCGTARLARLAEEPHLASPIGGAALPLALLTQLAAAPPSPHGSGSAPLVPPTGRRRSRATAAPRRGGRSPTRRLGREARREIGSHAADSASSCRLARGITCPPPGVNRDPPAQAPAGTFRPGGRPEPPPVHKPDERTGHHLSVAMSLRHHEARHRAAPEVEYERLRALRS